MRVRVGTAGLPNIAKSKGYLRGLKILRQLGLDLLEIEFVYGIDMSLREAEEVGKLAQRLDIVLTVHAPYFINFCAEKLEKRRRSLERVIRCLEYCKVLHARYLVVHAAYYMSYGPTLCYRHVYEHMCEIVKYIERENIETKIAVETMGKDSQFGTLEEVVKLCREVGVEYVVPCIDWAHIYLRQRGRIDYVQVLSYIVENLPELRQLHTHFTGLSIEDGKLDDKHDTIDTDRPPLRPLVEALLMFKQHFTEVTIVCESPLLEKDALKIKKLVLELLSKSV